MVKRDKRQFAASEICIRDMTKRQSNTTLLDRVRQWKVPSKDADTLRKIYRMLAAMLLANLLATVIMFIAVGLLLHLRTEVNAAQSTQDKIRTLYMALSDTESAQRGYIITGNQGYLDSYHKNANDAKRRLNEVQHIAFQPDDKAAMQNLTTISQQKIDEMESTLQTRERGGLTEASDMIQLHLGANLMSEVRSQINDVSNSIDKDVERRRQQSELVSTIALVVLVANLLATIATATASYRLFQKLQESRDELINLSRSKDEFLALASHQLRTPATAVKQYLSLSLDGFAGELTPSQQEILQKAHANNERQIAIVNDILQVTKLDLKALKFHKEWSDIGRIVKLAARDASGKIELAHHQLTLKSAEKKYYAYVDEQYIRTVVDNLIDNAIKYSPNGSTIKVGVQAKDDHIVITVKDNGVGIDPKDQGLLFKKFSRVDNPLSIIAGGTGLGLYWCKEIVELHHGHITLDSELGEGSLFTVYLPSAHPKMTA